MEKRKKLELSPELKSQFIEEAQQFVYDQQVKQFKKELKYPVQTQCVFTEFLTKKQNQNKEELRKARQERSENPSPNYETKVKLMKLGLALSFN